MSDLRFAFRQLLKNPGFTTIAMVTLALGIGANTAMFSVVDCVLLKPLPFDEPGRLVQVWEAPAPGKRNWASPGAFLDWRDNGTVFENLSLLDNRELNLTGEGQPERISGFGMSASGLRILRMHPHLGRVFAEDEDQPGKDGVIVLSFGFWQRRFGSDPSVLGRTLQLNNQRHTVIGVLAPVPLPWGPADFVIPIAVQPSDVQQRGSHWLQAFGRLKAGETLEHAASEMSAIAARLRSLYPAWKKDWGVTLMPLHEQITGSTKPTLLVLLGAVGMVLIIACSNVANLLLAKCSGRRKEMALRAALGAGKWRIVRQLLTESLLLSMGGTFLGLLLSVWAIGTIKHLNAVKVPRISDVSLDPRALGFAVLISILAAIVFGLAPALETTRIQLVDALNESARTSGPVTRNRVRSGLIIGEVALSIVLLVGAGLLLNSFYRLCQVSSGVNPRNTLTMQLTLPDKKYPDAMRRTDFFQRILEHIGALPGVQAAGIVGKMPVAGGSMDATITLPGRTDAPPNGHPVDFDFCTPDYFRAAGIPLRSGRFFSWRDKADAPHVVIINEALARRHFPNQNPLGQRIHLGVSTGKSDEGWEIVGIVGDVRQHGLGQDLRPCVYRPQAFSFISGGNLLVRTLGPPMAMAETVRKSVLDMDADQPVANIRTLEETLARSLGHQRFILVVLSGFAGTALLLAAIGLYGVIAYTVTQRTREIGIRMALGANRRDVLHLVVRQGMRLVFIGLAIGLVGALGLMRVLVDMLYGVKPTDPATLAGVSVVLLCVAFLACWLPARRAMGVQPLEALRTE